MNYPRAMPRKYPETRPKSGLGQARTISQGTRAKTGLTTPSSAAHLSNMMLPCRQSRQASRVEAEDTSHSHRIRNMDLDKLNNNWLSSSSVISRS